MKIYNTKKQFRTKITVVYLYNNNLKVWILSSKKNWMLNIPFI